MLIMRGCLLGLWIIIILLTSGCLCFVRVCVVSRSRGILFILGIQSAKREPLVSNTCIGLIQSAKGEPLVSNIGLIQSPKGEPLVSNIVLIQSPQREPLVSNIIIILGETRLPHSLEKPDCYARSNSPDNCR